MIVITGSHSTIASELRKLLPAEEAVMPWRPTGGNVPRADRYFFCQGLLRSRPIWEQTPDELDEGYVANCASIVWACQKIFEDGRPVRICIMGSESAYRGSYDGAYAAFKRDLHQFIETATVGPGQQIIGVSPSIIADAGMTTRREDAENLEKRRLAHPKQRFATSKEVAEVAFFCLYGASDYLTNTIIRMHGGLQ